MLACLVWAGFRRFKSGMPVAGSCSLAIAATCHSYVANDMDGLDQLGAEYQKLKWGVESRFLERLATAHFRLEG